MITVQSSGSFQKTEKFLSYMQSGSVFQILDSYGRQGVEALSRATPKDTGLTAESWYYEVINRKGRHQIIWRNKNVVDGLPVAIIIQYGHGTGTGGWVEGKDYINPAIYPLFDKMAKDVWERVKHA
jgi:hypothetical protein